MKPSHRRHLRPPQRLRLPVAPDESDAIRETLGFIRAHSSIRFIALPFFLGGIALLVKAFYEPGALPRPVVVAAALGLCAVAMVFEVVLSRNLVAWWTGLEPVLARNPHWKVIASHRHAGALHWVRWALFLPYLVSFAFWLHKAARLGLPAPDAVADRQHMAVLAVGVGLVCVLICLVVESVWKGATKAP